MSISNRAISIYKCNDCGSDLVLVEVTVHTIGNNPSPITKSTFRCSNQSCQNESDKRAAKKEELRKEQELARENRKRQRVNG